MYLSPIFFMTSILPQDNFESGKAFFNSKINNK